MTTHTEALSDRVMGRVRQAICGLHGHDSLLAFDHDRMYLRCVSCGHETPGWEVGDTPAAEVPAIRPAAQAATRPLMQPHLISFKRVA